MFGGHECAKEALMITCVTGKMVCKKCGDRADKLNKKRLLGVKHDRRWKDNN
jgi:hypothetical protein